MMRFPPTPRSKAKKCPQLLCPRGPSGSFQRGRHPGHRPLSPRTAAVMEYLHLALRPICSVPPLLTRSEVRGPLLGELPVHTPTGPTPHPFDAITGWLSEVSEPSRWAQI